MRIVWLAPSFTEELGYIINTLPFEMARQGAQVIIVPSALLPGAESSNDAKLASLLGYQNRQLGEYEYKNVRILRIKHYLLNKRVLFRDIHKVFTKVKPIAGVMTWKAVSTRTIWPGARSPK